MWYYIYQQGNRGKTFSGTMCNFSGVIHYHGYFISFSFKYSQIQISAGQRNIFQFGGTSIGN